MDQLLTQDTIKFASKQIHKITNGLNSMIEKVHKLPIKRFFNIKKKGKFAVYFIEEILSKAILKKIKSPQALKNMCK